MKIQSIEFESYKAFPEKHLMKVRPITIVIGRNSSGKSAFSRLPLLLANSLSLESGEPLSLSHNGVEFGGTFIDLIHNHLPHGNLKISMHFEGEITLSFEVQNINGTPMQMIKNWSIYSPEYNLSMEIILNEENIRKSEQIQYKKDDSIVLVSFRGLLPYKITDGDGNEIQMESLDSIVYSLNNFAKGVNYIGPYRQIPQRVYFHTGKLPTVLGVKGENTPQILAMSSIKGGKLLEETADWYEKYLSGWRIDVKNIENFFQIVLRSPDDPNVEINIVDVGQGMSQVLPLIVQSYMQTSTQNYMSIIEQPELHLHPAAHAELAELFAIAAKKNNTNYILETHSENIILRIRRLIVEKKLSEDDVIIYWINDEDRPGSKIKEIFIDNDGDLSDWPQGVFSEDYEEVIAIRKAQKDKHAN